jgi:hypothetical protein
MESITGAQLRIRDKAILDGHKKELAARDVRYQRLQREMDVVKRQMFEYKNGQYRAIEAMGFQDFVEARTFIDSLEEGQPSYRDALAALEDKERQVDIMSHRLEEKQFYEDQCHELETRCIVALYVLSVIANLLFLVWTLPGL